MKYKYIQFWAIYKKSPLFYAINNLTNFSIKIEEFPRLGYLNLYENNNLNLPFLFESFKNCKKDIYITNQGSSLNCIGIYLQEMLDSSFTEIIIIVIPVIKELPKEIVNLTTLTSLELRYSELKTLPEEIKNIKSLKKLEINDKNFSEEEKQKVEKWLPNCKIVWKSWD